MAGGQAPRATRDSGRGWPGPCRTPWQLSASMRGPIAAAAVAATTFTAIVTVTPGSSAAARPGELES